MTVTTWRGLAVGWVPPTLGDAGSVNTFSGGSTISARISGEMTWDHVARGPEATMRATMRGQS